MNILRNTCSELKRDYTCQFIVHRVVRKVDISRQVHLRYYALHTYGIIFPKFIIPGKQVPQMGSVTHVTPYSKSTYKLLVSTWELSINDPNLAHVSETVDDLHHVQPGGIHPPTRHRIQPTPFPSRNATLGTVGQKFTAQGHHPATLGFLLFFYYAASHTTTTHNHHI